MSPVLSYAKSRLDSVLKEISRLMQSEFPYQQSRDALVILRGELLRQESLLDRLDSRTDAGDVRLYSQNSLEIINVCVPLLGFILRSTNVRNAFEVYHPFLALASEVLKGAKTASDQDQETSVLLSSEWRYMPYTIRENSMLPNFVLIGLTATESDNPLLVPLAGHELGHTLWNRKKLGVRKYEELVEQEIRSFLSDNWTECCALYDYLAPEFEQAEEQLFEVPMYRQAFDWATRQVQETFCDCVAIMTFGKSYLNAFAYLLAPGSGLRQDASYPTLGTRAFNMVQAAERFGVEPPPDYESLFTVESALQSFAERAADMVLAGLFQQLMDDAYGGVPEHCRVNRSDVEVDEILFQYGNRVVPKSGVKKLSSIINAAWKAYSDDKLWGKWEHVFVDKERVLRDLVLKNVELFEYEHILDEGGIGKA